MRSTRAHIPTTVIFPRSPMAPNLEGEILENIYTMVLVLHFDHEETKARITYVESAGYYYSIWSFQIS